MKRNILIASTLGLATALAGCGGGGDGGPKLPAFLSSPDASNFLFDTSRGGPSVHAFHWTNTGDLETGALAVTLSGDTHAFSIKTDECSQRRLAKGNSCAVFVE